MFNMPIKSKSFNAIHWGSDAGSQMPMWLATAHPDFDNL